MVPDYTLKSLDIIVPVFNEEDSLPLFHESLLIEVQKIPNKTRIIYVDDGSTDKTLPILIDIINKDHHTLAIQLSRNFGHQAALTAGLEFSDADLVITMDGDGQHPPKLIAEMLIEQSNGYDIVQAKRINYEIESKYKRLTSTLFYWLINILSDTKIEQGTSDFRLITSKVLKAFRSIGDYQKFIRGIIPWLGFSDKTILYKPERRIAGKSKYTISKMLHLAESAIFSFSQVPLRIGLFLGVSLLFLALMELIYVLSFWFTGKQYLLVPGWSSIVFLILLTGGSIMILISILGIYIGQINQQVKNRPSYIIKDVYVYNKFNK